MGNQSLSFLNHFSKLEDHRQSTKILYPLDELLLLCLCGVISGAEDFTDITIYGEEKLDFLRTLLPYKHGIPSHDALNDFFRSLDSRAFERCFAEWSRDICTSIPSLIAIDGKNLRGSKDGSKRGIHLVSAWAADQKLVMAQVKTEEKSNEITAIPELLDLLIIKGAIITIDAMGCQKSITAKITEKEADYVLSLKGNHKDLYQDVVAYFNSEEAKQLAVFETNDSGHGRIETREYSILGDIDWLNERHCDWSNLNSIGMVKSSVTLKNSNDLPKTQTRYFICSITPDPKVFAHAVPPPYFLGHWGIENSLHWVLDVTFNEDKCRIRKDNAPHIFSVFKHSALNLINKNKGKKSVKSTRKQAGWNNKILKNILCS